MATVIGPTPPGTGVIAEATSATLGEMDVAAERAVVAACGCPTSMTDGPGLDPVAVGPARAGRPRRSRMSAWRAMAAASRVAVWQTVTVASPPGPFLQEQQGHGLADDLRAAEHDRVRSAGLDLGVEQEGTDSQGRARHEPGLPIASRPTFTG